MPYWTVFYKKIKGEEGMNGKFFIVPPKRN